ncbi:hypothetical protein PAEPH01_2170 [Pancytospora epiphaga]|nr:hypothetical protein PAEPH01_2170 [Pancytospora epiphaga]
MDDTLGLLQNAEQELTEIHTELNFQGEKVNNLHAKVIQFKTNLYKNDAALGKLNKALRTSKFIIIIFMMFILFSTLAFIIIKTGNDRHKFIKNKPMLKA